MTHDDPDRPGPADFAPTEASLPGLEPPERRESALEVATRRTIAQLHAEGVVDERHSMLLQLMLELAGMVARSGHKPAAGAMAATQMRECYIVLVDRLGDGIEVEGGEGRDPWDQLASDLRAAAVRDAAQPPAED